LFTEKNNDEKIEYMHFKVRKLIIASQGTLKTQNTHHILMLAKHVQTKTGTACGKRNEQVKTIHNQKDNSNKPAET